MIRTSLGFTGETLKNGLPLLLTGYVNFGVYLLDITCLVACVKSSVWREPNAYILPDFLGGRDGTEKYGLDSV